MGRISNRGVTKADPEEKVPASLSMTTSMAVHPQDRGFLFTLQAPWLPRASLPSICLQDSGIYLHELKIMFGSIILLLPGRVSQRPRTFSVGVKHRPVPFSKTPPKFHLPVTSISALHQGPACLEQKCIYSRAWGALLATGLSSSFFQELISSLISTHSR